MRVVFCPKPLSAKACARLIVVFLLAFWGLVFVCLWDPTRKLFGW